MRFTVSLEDDLYRTAKSLAKAQDISISKSINLLIRRGLKGEPNQATSGRDTKISTFPVSSGCKPFSEEQVKDLEVAEEIDKWNGS